MARSRVGFLRRLSFSSKARAARRWRPAIHAAHARSAELLEQRTLLSSVSLISAADPNVAVDTSGVGAGNVLATPNARFVLFSSDAGDLVAGDTNNATDVFVRDTLNGSLHLVSTTGSTTGSGTSFGRQISNDGRFVLFESNADDLVANDKNGVTDVFVRDLVTGTTHLASTNGSEAGNASSTARQLTQDGRFVLFESNASDLAAGDANKTTDVFVRDLVNNTTHLVSTTGAGAGDDASFATQITESGRFVLFDSFASDLAASDPKGSRDIFVRDLISGTTELVSQTTSGPTAGLSTSRSITQDGRYVLFNSSSGFLVGGDTNGSTDAFVRDLLSNTTTLVSTTGSAAGSFHSFAVSMTANGRFVLFESLASDIVKEDNNNANDIFVRDLVSGVTHLVSATSAGVPGNASSRSIQMTDDGRYVLFESNASDLAAKDTNNEQDVFVRDVVTGATHLVSIGKDAPGNGLSFAHRISQDGRYALFRSKAGDLVAGDNNSTDDVFVRDLAAGTTSLVSTTGSGSGRRGSFAWTMSSDGRKVVFESLARNFVANDHNDAADVFVRDLQAASTILVTRRDAAVPRGTAGGESNPVAVTPDGRYVLFESSAGNLVPGDTNDRQDVFVRDVVTGTTRLVSTSTGGISNASSFATQITDDGRYVLFGSDANNLVSGDTNGTFDVFVRDLQNASTRLISRTDSGTGNGTSNGRHITQDGRYVLFDSHASNLLPGDIDTNGKSDVFVRDIFANTTHLVSITEGRAGNDASFAQQLTDDGRFVLFESVASDLAPGQTNGFFKVFVRDLVNGITHLVSTTGQGAGNAGSNSVEMTEDGRYVLFESDAGDLVKGDANNARDVFLRDIVSAKTHLVSIAGNEAGNGSSSAVHLTSNGQHVLFSSAASNLVANDLNGTFDVFVRDLVAGTTQLVSTTGDRSGDAVSTPVQITEDGRYVLFDSDASDLVPDDENGGTDVFVRDLIAGKTFLVSAAAKGTGNNPSFAGKIAGNGRYVLFRSSAGNLVSGDGNNRTDVFVRDLQRGVTHLVSTTGSRAGNNDSRAFDITEDGRHVLFASNASNLKPDDYNRRQDVFVFHLTFPPVAVDDSLTITEDSPPVVSATGVLENDLDADAITAVNGDPAGVGNTIILRSGALVRINADGSYSYDPNGAFERLRGGVRQTDEATYTISNGEFSAIGRINITILGVNDVPSLTIGAGRATWRENNPPVLLSAATVTDPDVGDFDTGTLTVRIIADGRGTDRLQVLHAGDGPGQVGVSGSEVRYGGVKIGSITGGAGTSALRVIFNSASNRAAVQAVARRIAYSNVSEEPGGEPRTVEFVLTDGDGGTSAVAYKVVNVQSVNDPPAINVGTANAGYRENDPPKILTSAIVTDVDSTNFENGKLTVRLAAGGRGTDRLQVLHQGTGAGEISVSGSEVRISGILIGSVTGGVGTNPLVVTFGEFASRFVVQAVARRIAFSNVSDDPGAQNRSVQFVLTDGDGGTSAAAQKTVIVTPVNDPPTINVGPGNAGYRENDPPKILSPSALVTDLDSANFDKGKLTVRIASGGRGTDRLQVLDQGNAAGEVGVSGSEIRFGGTLVGTLTGGVGTNALVVTFNAQATPAAVQAVLRRIAFSNVSDDPGAQNRSVQFVLTDGDGGTSATAQKTLVVTAVNDRPAIGLQGTINYTTGNPPLVLAGGAAVTDPDSADFNQGRLTVRFASGGLTTDRLAVLNQGEGAGQIGVSGSEVRFGGTRIGTFSGGSGTTPLVVIFNTQATRAAVQAVLRRIAYSNVSNAPGTDDRQIQFVLTDGDGGTSDPAVKTVRILPPSRQTDSAFADYERWAAVP